MADEQDWFSELNAIKNQEISMIQHILLLHNQAGGLYVFDASSSKKNSIEVLGPSTAGKHEELNLGKLPRKKVLIARAHFSTLILASEEGYVQIRKAEVMSSSSVEKSFEALAELVSSFDAQAFSEKEKATQWRNAVKATRWISGLRRLLKVTNKVVAQIQLGYPVPP